MLKELMNDNTITTGATDSASIVAKTVHRLYISVIQASNNYDLDSIHLTARIGETTIISRFSLEQLGAIWCSQKGGDPGSFAGGDQTGDTVIAIDLGTWVVPKGSKFYVELDNSDPESQVFNVSAMIDSAIPVQPLQYNKSDDGNFSVDGLVDAYAWDSNGTLDATASYFQINGTRISVEQAYMATVAEAPVDFSAVTSFAVLHQNQAPTDSEIQNEQSSTVTTLYVTQVENDEIDEAVRKVYRPMIAAQISKLSHSNLVGALRKSGLGKQVKTKANALKKTARKMAVQS